MKDLTIRKFQRKKEDFLCEKCATLNHGNGYTNHCRECLWSKHVDINPGDRSETCLGMMKPVGLEYKKGKYFILQECVKCGFQRLNSVRDEDNFDAVLDIIKKAE
jgi:hypothetical protein